METDVLVVGAGPAGLMAANLLARSGVRTYVIDKEPGPTQQSRADLVQVRTLELWDKLGLAAPAVERGQPIAGTQIWAGGKLLADIPTNSRTVLETPYPFGLTYEQSKTQRMLAEALAAVDAETCLEWGTRLLGLDQDANGITAHVATADGTEKKISAAWGIGADGSHSTVRELLGVPFEGGSYDQIGFLADVDMDFGIDVRPDRINMFVAPIGSVGFGKYHSTSQSQYRLFGTVTPGLQIALQALRAEQSGGQIGVSQLQRWFDEQFRVPGQINRCHWYYSYRLHHKIAARFRVGRWFLTGDAAHAHPPSGGQGANLSMGDGYNLGWKLGAVVAGEMDPAILDSYDVERRGCAMSILSGSDKGFKLEAASSSLVWRKMRQWLLPAALRVANKIPAARDQPSRLMSQQWIRYPDSPIVTGTATKGDTPGPGHRAPDAMLAFGGGRLFDLLRGVDHHLLILHGDSDSAAPQTAGDIADLLAGFVVRVQVHVLGSEHAQAQRSYRVAEPTVVLVRPDGHIGYRGPFTDLAGLRDHLSRWYKPSASATARVDSSDSGRR